MNAAATLSFCVAALGTALALISFRVSRGPGMRDLFWFGVASLLAAAFCATNAAVTLTESPLVLARCGRVTLAFAGLHGAAWWAYFAAQHARPLTRFERAATALACAFALAALVPGLLVTEQVAQHRVEWLGVTYTDAVPTALGELCYGYYCLGLLVIVVRYARERGVRRLAPRTHIVGLGALTGAAASDSFAASGVVSWPYLTDLGFGVLVVSVAAAISARFVAGARELERAHASLRAAHAELVKSERLAAIGELSAVVAHEVRNPLAVIFNVLASLRRLPPGAPEGAELLAMVEEEAERLKRMVTGLLEFARPPEVTIAKSDVPALVARAVEAAARVSEGGIGAVALEVEPGLPELRCDEQLVRQAVINLVTNALQAEGRRGVVRVEVARAGDAIAVRVVDDGKGVTAEVAAKLFTPFYTTRASGTGLGLAVVQRVAEAHGGRIAHEPTPGGGATFELLLPLAGDVAR